MAYPLTYFQDKVSAIKEEEAEEADEKDQDDAYRAATGAMSLNFNSVVIEVRPGAKVGAATSISWRRYRRGRCGGGVVIRSTSP